MFRNLIKYFMVPALLGAVAADVSAQTAQLDAVANESSGQYAPMNMGYAGFNSLGMTQAAWLDPLQNLGEGQSRPAYSKYYWSPDLVLPIRLREGMITLINFPSWEMIEDVFIGDNATFDGQISGPNTVLLYPRKGANVGVDTNVIIFGRSGNRYVFYVKSEAVNTERLTNSIIDIEVIDDKNGENGGKAATLGSPLRGGSVSRGGSGSSGPKSADSTYTRRFLGENWLKEIPVDPTKFRFDIEVYVPNPEDVVIAPERVWRDDIFTYVDFGNKALNMNQRPIATLIVERLEVPVGFRTKLRGSAISFSATESGLSASSCVAAMMKVWKMSVPGKAICLNAGMFRLLIRRAKRLQPEMLIPPLIREWATRRRRMVRAAAEPDRREEFCLRYRWRRRLSAAAVPAGLLLSMILMSAAASLSFRSMAAAAGKM